MFSGIHPHHDSRKWSNKILKEPQLFLLFFFFSPAASTGQKGGKTSKEVKFTTGSLNRYDVN